MSSPFGPGRRSGLLIERPAMRTSAIALSFARPSSPLRLAVAAQQNSAARVTIRSPLPAVLGVLIRTLVLPLPVVAHRLRPARSLWRYAVVSSPEALDCRIHSRARPVNSSAAVSSRSFERGGQAGANAPAGLSGEDAVRLSIQIGHCCGNGAGNNRSPEAWGGSSCRAAPASARGDP